MRENLLYLFIRKPINFKAKDYFAGYKMRIKHMNLIVIVVLKFSNLTKGKMMSTYIQFNVIDIDLWRLVILKFYYKTYSKRKIFVAQI